MDQPQTIWKAFNPQTRRYESVDPQDGEFFPGDQVMRLFYCRQIGRYVTIPGASLYEFDQAGDLALIRD